MAVADVADDADPEEPDPRGGLAADERALLEGFDRLRPTGTLAWAVDDVVGRLDERRGEVGRSTGWGGLPADLWDRGRSAKAAERMLGDVVKAVAQNLSEYTDRATSETQRLSDEALSELRAVVHDALSYLAARVTLLESSRDPLGLVAADLDLAPVDASAWVGDAAGWLAARPDLPVVVGELGDDGLLAALVATGGTVEGVDPRGRVVWDVADGGAGRVEVALAEVVDHLRGLPDGSRGCVVLSGCVDRLDLAGKAAVLDEAVRVLAPGGILTLLVTDQAAWDGSLGPVVRDLVPGRPLHPETWQAVLARRGVPGADWRRPSTGDVHAVVAEVRR